MRTPPHAIPATVSGAPSPPGTCSLWAARTERSRLSNGSPSCHLIEPTKATRLGLVYRSAPTGGTSKSPFLVQYPAGTSLFGLQIRGPQVRVLPSAPHRGRTFSGRLNQSGENARERGQGGAPHEGVSRSVRCWSDKVFSTASGVIRRYPVACSLDTVGKSSRKLSRVSLVTR